MKKLNMKLSLLAMVFVLFCLIRLPVLAAPAASEANPPQTPGWHYENNSYRYYYKYGSNVISFKSTGVIQITKSSSLKTATRTTVFKPGFYYFHLGALSISPNGVGSYQLYKVSADGSLVNNGWYKFSKKPLFKSTTDTSITLTPKTAYFTGQDSQKVYYNGKVYTGIAKKNDCYYQVKYGVYKNKYTGTLKSSYIDVSRKRLAPANQKFYKNGVQFTGIYNRIYYIKGYKENYTGWKKLQKNLYYFKKGTAVTGTCYLKSYGGGSQSYRYTFDSQGVLKTNLFEQGSIDYYRQKLKIEVNITTHTITIYMYDSKTKSYDIPLKAFICSTSKKKGATKAGNFTLSKGSRTRWFKPKKNSSHYYQWGVFIKGSYSWFHSEYYRAKNIYALSPKIYNGLGTNQTSACIRTQVVNAKLIYDIAAKNKYTVPVHIFRSSNKGAFGQILLSDTTGKLPLDQKYDPTDHLVKK